MRTEHEVARLGAKEALGESKLVAEHEGKVIVPL